jgi:CheY-like chemotaxis protein/tetratricopeptide (TPR) repeat protein
MCSAFAGPAKSASSLAADHSNSVAGFEKAMPSVILHVDDRPELPEGVAEALRGDGYEILTTADPEEVIRLLVEREPALVVMELELPGCDGLDLLAGIREERPSLPVLIVTRALRDSGLHGEAIAVGIVDFLSKPVRPAELLATIRGIAPPSAAAEEPDPEPDDPGPVELAGRLADTPLPELLARLRRRGATGVVVAGQSQARVGVQLRNGSPCAVSGGRRRKARRGSRSEEEVESAIGRRAEAVLFEAFGWTDGSYRFAENRRLKSDTTLEISREPADLLLAGVLEAAPAELVSERLRKRASLYLMAAEELEDCLEGVDLTREQRRTLVDLGGEYTLHDMLETHAFEERLLYGLWVAGLLELHAAPILTLTELHCEPASDAVAGDAAPGVDPEASAVTVRELAKRVLVGDDFDVLDVPIDAPEDGIHRAYETLLQRISDVSLGGGDIALQAQTERIRRRVESAYEHLKDPEVRHAYALLRREEEEDRAAKPSAERALEAERWFRKGMGRLKSKRHAEAAEAFGMAAHLDPEQGEYVAHLGYALYLSKPKDKVVQREAMEHIANGIKRSPASELSYVYLGRIMRAKGDMQAARKLFQRALKIKPDCHAAIQEMRLLEMRRKKDAGLLSRLLKR